GKAFCEEGRCRAASSHEGYLDSFAEQLVCVGSRVASTYRPACKRWAQGYIDAMSLVSLLLPTFSGADSDRAPRRLCWQLRATFDHRFEVLVVDDSPESFRDAIRAFIAKRASELAPQIEVRLVVGERRGKGNAIRRGVLESRGEFVFTVDADLPVPLRHI